MNIKNIILILFACLFLQINIFSQQTFTAKVVGVVDGDTITILMKDKSQKTVQIKGIDAPELEQSFGKETRQKLSELILDKTIFVEYSKLQSNGEILGKVLLKDKDIALEMIQSGFAWVDNEQKDSLNNDEIKYTALQDKAKNESIGLWRDKEPQRPAEFRKNLVLARESQRANIIDRNSFEGQVIEVIDGSTIAIIISNGSRQSVCIKYLETPEPGQPKADIAKQHLKDLLLQKNVRVKVSGFSEDEYCMTADVYLNDVNINLQMVRDGIAWVNSDYYYPEGYYTFKAAEESAKSERRGIWEDPLNPIMPSWEYRARYYQDLENRSPIFGYGGGNNTPNSSGNKTVQVRGYTRSNGTYVRPHTRSAPGSGTSRSRSGGRRN